MSIYLFLEIISTLSGIACVYFQTQEKIIAWPFGILSVTLAVFIFYREMLYSDFILHMIYIVLNIYGWWYWLRQAQKPEMKDRMDTNITAISNLKFLFWLCAILLISFVWGSFMDKYFNASYPFLDAFTTAGSLIAQYLLARKVLQNWLVWIVVDIVAVGVYYAKDLYFFSALFFVYLLLCIKGYRDWRNPRKNKLNPEILEKLYS